MSEQFLPSLQTIAVIAIPLVGAWLAWQQVQIARVKLQHDLFERRYNVFAAARRLLAQIDTHRRPSDEDLRAFMLGTSDAVFLFDDDLAGYLIEMGLRARKLQTLEKLLETQPNIPPTIPIGPGRAQSVNEAEEHFSWFVAQLNDLVEKFKPFLKLEK
jgi:hypothetical protein